MRPRHAGRYLRKCDGETRTIVEALVKLSALLQMGFGAAGSSIIARHSFCLCSCLCLSLTHTHSNTLYICLSLNVSLPLPTLLSGFSAVVPRPPPVASFSLCDS